MKVVSRYLDWVNDNNLSSDQVKVAFWGQEMGSSGVRYTDVLTTFLNFVGSSALTTLTNGVITPSADNLETYAFQLDADSDKRVVFVFPTTDSESVTVDRVTISKQGWGGAVSGTLHTLAKGSVTTSSVTVTENTADYAITLPSAQSLAAQTVLMFFLEK